MSKYSSCSKPLLYIHCLRPYLLWSRCLLRSSHVRSPLSPGAHHCLLFHHLTLGYHHQTCKATPYRVERVCGVNNFGSTGMRPEIQKSGEIFNDWRKEYLFFLLPSLLFSAFLSRARLYRTFPGKQYLKKSRLSRLPKVHIALHLYSFHSLVSFIITLTYVIPEKPRITAGTHPEHHPAVTISIPKTTDDLPSANHGRGIL